MLTIKREYADARERNDRTEDDVQGREEYRQVGDFGPLTFAQLLNILLIFFGSGVLLGFVVTFLIFAK